MQKITRIAALLLVVLAVVLAVLAFSLGRRASTSPGVQVTSSVTSAPNTSPNASATSLVVAANALPAGQPITPAELRVATIATPRSPDSYVNVDDVAGDIPLVDVPAGAPITAGLLAHGVAMALQPGERALAVPVDELAGAGNRILPGDYVDVFLSIKDSQTGVVSGTKEDQSQTRLLLSRLRVLAYGEQNLPAPAASANKPAATGTTDKAVAKSDTPTVPHTAVLAVPVNEVDRLLLGAQNGKLALALRHPSDPGQPDDGLFQQPPMVLAPLVSLSVEQRQQLALPENDAYAGVGGDGLAGHDNRGNVVVHHAGATPGVEIIRGTSLGDAEHTKGAGSP